VREGNAGERAALAPGQPGVCRIGRRQGPFGYQGDEAVQRLVGSIDAAEGRGDELAAADFAGPEGCGQLGDGWAWG
jgi:hypothetical protein